MRKVLGSITLLVLVFNTLLTPLTYAEEYEEIIETSSENTAEEVVEETGEEESSSEFSVEEENTAEEKDEENEEETAEETAEEEDGEEWEEIENSTWDNVEDWTWEISEIGSWEIEGLTGKTVEWETWDIVEVITWTTEELTWAVEESIWTWEETIVEEIKYNEEPIIWEETYDNVTVKVEALSWTFPEWTELVIDPIRYWNLVSLKRELVEERNEIWDDTTLVAFDITFRYEWEEVQPKEWEKVKVTFDYSKNEELVESDKDEDQEVKVYHIEDKDEEWNKVEDEEKKIRDVTNVEESEEDWIAVADWKSFSVYAVVATSGNWLRVTYDLNWWYWIEDHSFAPKTVIYTGTKTTLRYRTPSKTWYMFMWWYLTWLTTRRNWAVTDGMSVYAKWEPFYDLYTYFLIDQDNIAHKTIMDRNVWATEIYNQNYGKQNAASYWYYFQWWNNYWIGNSSDVDWTKDYIVTSSIWSLWISSKYYSRKLRSNDEKKNWMDSTNNSAGLWWWTWDTATTEWDNSTLEWRQWPCPEGYHVPSTVSWQQLFNEWNQVYNYKFKSTSSSPNISNIRNGLWLTFLLPPAGRYQWSKIWWNGTDLSYWASSEVVADRNTAHWFYIGQHGIQPIWIDIDGNSTMWDYKNRARSVRCFKNDNSSYLWNIELKWWTWWIISIASWEVKSLKNPTRNNDTFYWWYTTSDFSWNAIITWSRLQQWDSLYAKWCQDPLVDNGTNCVNAKTITFDTDGWSGIPTQYITPWGTWTRPLDPEKDGYTFVGWYYTWLETEYDFETPVTSDITIYAKWNLIDYHITYELNWWTGLANIWIYTIETDSFILNNPTKDDYIFEWWSGINLPECTMGNTLNCEKNVTITQWSTWDRSYEAIWWYIKYDLIFDSIWGSEVESQIVIKWRTWTRPLDPEKDGYTFVGWYYTWLETEYDFETPVTSDITIYAKWNLIDYHITYELNWWTGLANTWIYTIETDSFTLNNPSKLNYEFIWWSGTNLSWCSVENQTTCNTTVTVEQWSVWNRVYEAIYDCAYWRKLDWTCNIVKGEDWLIDYENWEYNDLEVDLSVTDPVKIVIMDRNLWAAVSGVEENAFWFYYQWWNNYWFRNVIEKTSTEQVDASAYWSENYYISDTFILQDSSGWDAPVNYNLWWWTWDTTSKRWDWDDEARQWPCPSGYHVPSILEWHKLNSFANTWRNSENATDVCSEFDDNRQCVLSKFLKLPRAGNILWKDGSFQSYDGGYLGRYWSSSRHNDNRAYRYRINGNWDISQWLPNNTNNYSYYNSQWMSVRCFKNVSSKPIVYELSWWVQSSNQTSTVVWWNESNWKELTIPTKTGFVFEWWYLTSWYEKWTRVTTNVISDYSDNENVTLYANWKEPESKTITYNANGWYFQWWSLSTGIVYKEEVESWNYVALTNVQFPNRVWYMFDGWYLTWGETEWKWFVDNSTEELTVYAKWLRFDDLTVTMNWITFTLMDRNLWATDYATWYTYWSDNVQNNQSRVWKYYQWWNNYWFSGTKNTNISSDDYVTNTNDFWPWNYFSRAAYVYSNWSWGDTHKNLWWWLYLSSWDVTRQGPCPVNYHVPTKNEWDKTLNLFNVWKQTDEGSAYCNSLANSWDMYCFSARLWLPFAGYLDWRNTLKDKGTHASYRSSNQRDVNNKPYRLKLSNMKTDADWNNGHGLPVRCFKNTERKALNFESKWGDINNAPTETVRWWEETSSLPTPTRSNSTFTWWYMTSWYEEGTRVSVNYVPTESDSVTLYAKWECDGWYIESEDWTSCINNIAIITYNAQAHSWTINSQPTSWEYVEYDTVVTLPTKNIVSLKSWYNFIWWTTTLNWTEKISNTYTVTGNVTFYPIFKKEWKQKDIKFYVNNNSWYIYNTVTYKEDKLFSGCTIPTLYNTDPYTWSCSVHITLPDIIAHENTQTVLWWSTWINERTISYTAWAGVTITIPENKEVELYAQTRSEEKTYTATYITDNRVEEVTETSDTCTIPVTYNGNPQQTVCTEAITLPNIIAKNGYNTPVWKLWETEYAFWAEIALSWNAIFTGTATPEQHTSYVVKHYYQTLTNTGIYELSWTDNLSWVTEDILTLSELQKEASSIPWFTYWNSRVNSWSDTSIDVTTINDFTNQWEIQPGLVIQLFYTRKSNTVTLNTIENAIVEKNPSKENYYYWESITFSGHANSWYTFSWWDIREWDAETGRREWNSIEYTMISTWVEVTPVVREHRYTIHYNASGAVGTMEDETVNYSEEVTLPTSGEVATHFTYTWHHFVWWTTWIAETTVITTLTKATPDDNGEITLYAKWEENDWVSYSVEYYLEPIEEWRPQSEYILQTADTHHGTAPQWTTVTWTVKNYPWFTSPAAEAWTAESEGSLVIKYYYTRNSYDYTFAAWEWAEFSDWTTSKTVSFRYEQSVVLPGWMTLVKTGFTFSNWNPVLGPMPSEAKASTAEWTENQYTINYNANGWEWTTPSQTVRYTDEVALTWNAFTKEWYVFTWWSKTTDWAVEYKDKALVSKLEATNNAIVTLYAQWSAEKYIVTFDANSWEVIPTTIEVTYDATYGELPTPNRTGYTFQWWYTAKEWWTKVISSTQVKTANDHTLYAHWEVKMYTVTFNPTGWEVTPISIEVTYDEEYGELPIPTTTGYRFAWWYTDAAEPIQVTATTKVTIAANHTLKAHWLMNHYSIAFNANGWAWTMEKITDIAYTGSVILLANTFTREWYQFKWWSKTENWEKEFNDEQEVSKLTGENDVTVTLYAVWSINTYTVTWKNSTWTVLKEETLPYWATPDYGGTPISWADAQYTYIFKWWEPEITPVTEDQVYTATYNQTINTYTITFKNEDWTELYTTWVAYWTTPVYSWVEPTKENTAQYTYIFKWWSPTLAPVTWEATYTATYTGTINKYTIRFVDEDGTELKAWVEYDYWTASWAIVQPDEPTKAWDAQYSYIFTWWTPELTGVTEDQVYTATYSQTTNSYPITFYDEDWVTKIKWPTLYPYWTETWVIVPVGTPTKDSDGTYTYEFGKWTPDLEPVVGTANYTATYKSTYIDYLVTFLDSTWAVLTSGYYHSWETVTIPTWPAKASTAQTGYAFKSWYPEVKVVTWDITYEPTYTETTRNYTITWKSSTWQTLRTDTLLYGSTPSYGENPTSWSTAEYEYTFKSWEPSIQTVTEDAIYTATYDSTKRKYPITWKNEDWTEIWVTDVEYGVVPAAPSIPSKDFTEQTWYVFNWWNPSPVAVTEAATYTATYAEYTREYTILWKDYDWTIIKTWENVSYWTLIVNNKPTTDPSREATAQTGYTFTGWYDEDGIKLTDTKKLTWDISYTARYDEALRTYTIIWNNRDGTELRKDLNQPYWKHLWYTWPIPTSWSTAQYTFTHDWWMPTVHDVTWPQVYTATYIRTVNSYPITFYDEDWTTVIEWPTMYLYWTTSWTYKPATNPSKEWYSFSKWTPDLESVVWTASYTATYTVNNYNVTPVKWVWVANILWWWSYPYNTVVTLTWIAKEWYHFEWWVSEKAFTYTVPSHNIIPQIDAEPNKYYVHFNWNGWVWTMEDQEFTYGVEQALIPNVYTYNWYYFMSWTDGHWWIFKDNSIVKNLASTWVITLIAQWWDTPWPTPWPTPTPTPSWWWSWWDWGWKRIDKDTQEHASAEIETWDIKEIEGTQTQTWTTVQTWATKTWTTIQWTEEELTAYKYAYKYWITTLAPKEAARPDAYVIRWHMAKMVVNYALNVLNRKLPAKMPKQCKWKDWKNAWESEEIKDYAEKACALWLMWIDMDYFQPYKLVTRAQFWTIFGRLLWWKLVSKPYYAEHLARLKKRWIMTQIDRPEERIEVRKWAWLMFMRSEKYFKVKK